MKYLAILLLVTACAMTREAPQSSQTAMQLWSETCSQCHAAPGRANYTDAEWDIVLAHMQMRGTLTKTEAGKIRDFLISE